MDEVAEIYDLSVNTATGLFEVVNLEDAIAALGLAATPGELYEIEQTVRHAGGVDREMFMEVMAFKLAEHAKAGVASADEHAELKHAFNMFLAASGPAAASGTITLAGLRQIARLAEDDKASDDDLREMLLVATGSGAGAVDFGDFCAVIRRCGATL
ncbi:uncharacterized protein V1510DRAFT_416308 [Dipodascopsis tothii]|uniref:uncharacterized protein n=1 Tax=Dipodascopsis tothii TaxID=44089 RepID=UPI0034CE308C